MTPTLLPTLALLLLAAAGHAQTRPVPPPPGVPSAQTAPPVLPPPAEGLDCGVLTGRVTDAANKPFVGATVLLRGAGFAAEPSTTNADGQYLLAVPAPLPRTAWLDISAGGHAPLALPLATCQPAVARLEPLPGTRFKADGRIKKTKASGKIR